MKYLLDTCTISYFVRGEKNVLTRLKATSPKEIVISTITKMEIEFGLQLNPDRSKKLKPVLNTFLESIQILSFTEKDAACSAAIRASLQKKGIPIGAYDILLAGTALHRGLILVTSNIAEFERVNGLLLEDWME